MTGIYAHGLALALPETVELACPTGFGRADAIDIRIPIEKAEWDHRCDGLTSEARACLTANLRLHVVAQAWTASVGVPN